MREPTRNNMTSEDVTLEQPANKWALSLFSVPIFHAPHPVEDRSILIASYDNKLWAAIYTPRGDVIRIISVRRARKREVGLYEKESPG